MMSNSYSNCMINDILIVVVSNYYVKAVNLESNEANLIAYIGNWFLYDMQLILIIVSCLYW